MADNEEEGSTSAASAATVTAQPGDESLSAAQPQTPAGDLPRAEGEDRGEPCEVTVVGSTVDVDEGSGQASLLHSGSAEAEAKEELIGATQELHILGTEVLTSFVQTSESVDGAVASECATVSGEFLNALAPATTIIYVQPDGSFVESSGLSAEEQQQLIEQLSKQQLVQVTGSEAARIFEPPHPPKTPASSSVSAAASAPSHTVRTAAITPADVQQVVEHVHKSQASPARSTTTTVQIPHKIQPRTTVAAQPTSFITLEAGSLISGAPLTATLQPQPFTIVQNAAQQLQTAAKQVVLQQQQSQNGTLIQPKPTEPIHIQVQTPLKQQELKQRQAAPITILQSPVKVSTVGTVTTPQIIHITPMPGQQQYFLQNPGEPPIQLLLQKPAPVVSSISLPIVRKIQAPSVASTAVTPAVASTVTSTVVPAVSPKVAPKVVPAVASPVAPALVPAVVPIVSSTVKPKVTLSPTPVKSPVAKPAVVATPPTLILTPTRPTTAVSSPTTKVLTPPTKITTVVTKVVAPTVEKEKPKVKNRQKKPLKIKTRSGRVSRPPKHKVKDYKFIKNEDLAESHQSDSDDYSEISVEDEEGEDGKKKGADDGLSLRKKAFKCEMCEKSYIGLAGLNRHYRIKPSHDKNQTRSSTERDSKPSEEQSGKGATKTSLVKTASTQKVQADSTRPIEKRRPGRPKGSGNKGTSLPKRLGRKPKRGRRGRPPKHLTAAATKEQLEQKRRNRLTEFIQQYDDEDLIEIVLPRLAKVMTVWEFVVMKAKKGQQSKQQFPSVYHEFELLHNEVKRMAEEHFSIAPASRPALDVTNMEVLKSLGISDPPSALTHLNSTVGQPGTARPNQAVKSLRSIENTKMLPPAKRFKMENCVEKNSNSETVNQNGIQKEESADGSSELREPQLVLTRLENINSDPVAGEESTDSDNKAQEERTEEEEPMDTADAPHESEDVRLQEDAQEQVSEVLTSGESVDVSDQMEQLEQALSTDAEHESGAPQETAGDLQDGNCDPPDVGSLSEVETVGEAVESQEIQPGHAEEVFIQTAEGLVRQSAEELASKGIVIVNGPDGTTMHIEAPEGVPLETVHALLGIETERTT
ncbi:zinc finger protein 839 [Astyanax mexicanus]|uniref:Zinc finger protein 839 n=1 Tax=Astyanax mexicanus TaxID=7994 RepID=A0A8T2LFN6_ASTMX|nr:zinc finger protein 839 [Astyanax mexicanus]